MTLDVDIGLRFADRGNCVLKNLSWAEFALEIEWRSPSLIRAIRDGLVVRQNVNRIQINLTKYTAVFLAMLRCSNEANPESVKLITKTVVLC